MKLRRVLFIIYCAVILNSVILFLFGDKGYLEYQALLEYKQKLTENIQKMIDKNTSLGDNLANLTADKNKIELLAREMGYYDSDSLPIIVDGYAPKGNFYEIGNIVNKPERTGDRNPILRIIVLCLGGCAIILDSIFSQRKKNGNQRY